MVRRVDGAAGDSTDETGAVSGLLGGGETDSRTDTGSPDADGLDGVSEARTLADVVDAAALGRWLPPAWSARTEVAKFGLDDVTEVLVLTGRGHQVVLDPQRTTDPEGSQTCYVRAAGERSRQEWGTLDSLHEGLATALERITDLDDRVDPVTPVERRAAELRATGEAASEQVARRD
jgi:hypothetical protein